MTAPPEFGAAIEDLRPWGYAPGCYAFRCIDCPDIFTIHDRMERMGDKRSSRCREHAIALRDATSTALPLAQPAAVEVSEVGRLRKALVDAREIILELIHARDCQYEGTDEEMVGFIDAILAPAAIASGREGAEVEQGRDTSYGRECTLRPGYFEDDME